MNLCSFFQVVTNFFHFSLACYLFLFCMLLNTYLLNPLHSRWHIRPQQYVAMCASPQVIPISNNSVIPVAVLRQVVFYLPCFLLPGGVHLRATLGIWYWSILSTCPSHHRHQRSCFWMPYFNIWMQCKSNILLYLEHACTKRLFETCINSWVYLYKKKLYINSPFAFTHRYYWFTQRFTRQFQFRLDRYWRTKSSTKNSQYTFWGQCYSKLTLLSYCPIDVGECCKSSDGVPRCKAGIPQWRWEWSIQWRCLACEF